MRVFHAPTHKPLVLPTVDLCPTGLLKSGKIFNDLLETLVLFNSDYCIVSIMHTDDLLPAHSKTDNIGILPKLQSKDLNNKNVKKGAERAPLSYATS